MSNLLVAMLEQAGRADRDVRRRHGRARCLGSVTPCMAVSCARAVSPALLRRSGPRRTERSRGRCRSTTWVSSISTSSCRILRPRPSSTRASSGRRCTSSRCATRCATSSCSATCRPIDRSGYIAIGAARGRAPAIGHYCVLAKVYERAGMASALQAAGYAVRRGAGADRHVAGSGRTRVAAISAARRPRDRGSAVAAAASATGCCRRAASITCCCVSPVSRSRCRTTGSCTALRPNGRATRTDASGFTWSEYAPRPRGGPPGQAPRSPTTRSRSRRSIAAR